MLTDTHCHLDFPQFDPDRAEVLERARLAGVERILIPGTSLETSRRALALAGRHAGVYAAVGVHPNESLDFGPAALQALRELARAPQVVAVGEIGIDLYWKTAPLEQQRAAFQAQLQLAAELGKPVIIHDREAHAEVMAELLAAAPGNGTILHAFSGGPDMATEALRRGYYLGVGGPLTYKKNEALREIFARAPLNRILIETDAPYLPPQSQRGRRNEPAYVRQAAEKLAEIRGLSLAEVEAATRANAAGLFGWE